MLRVDGVSEETLKELQASALKLYGKANASLLVRNLIAEHLAKAAAPAGPAKRARKTSVLAQTTAVAPSAHRPLTPAEVQRTRRVELRLPAIVVEELSQIAEARFSARNYYIASVLLAHLGEPQLQGDEIEVLRRSNYELAKIGTNLNQIARAFNTLVKMEGHGKVPEVSKKLSALRSEITEHTKKVLRVLKAGTPIWELRGKGRGQRVKQRK
jgi:hypothetical protein